MSLNVLMTKKSLVSLLVYTYFLWESYRILIPWSREGSTLSMIWLVMIVVGYVTSIWSYIVTCVREPSFVPKGWEPPANMIDPLNLDDEFALEYCDECQNWRPPRAKHCKSCKRCVMRMETHCPWMSCCIGYYNTKPYALFLWDSSCFLVQSAIVFFYWVWINLMKDSDYVCSENSFECYRMIFGSILIFFVGLIICFLCSWQFGNILFNITNQELRLYQLMFKEISRQRAFNQKKSNGSATQEEERSHAERMVHPISMGVWPYSFSDTFNWKQVMGDSILLALLPIGGPPASQGTDFVICSTWYKRREDLMARRAAMPALFAECMEKRKRSEAIGADAAASTKDLAKAESGIGNRMFSMEYSAGKGSSSGPSGGSSSGSTGVGLDKVD